VHKPRISVVIPTRNRARCLGELVASLRAQSLPEWEAIVVDDGSEPGQAQEIRKLTQDDPRFRILRRETEPQGACHCRNIGARAARADLILFFDDDDLLSPGCLEARVRVMEGAPGHDLVVFSYERFRVAPGDLVLPHRAFASEAALDSYLRIEPPFHTGSAVWRRPFLDRLGGWNEGLASWQDWEFGVRALCLKPISASHDEPRFFVRVASERHSNISGAWSPKHVRAWPVAVESGLSHVRAAGLLTGVRARLAGKLYLFIAERHVEIGDRGEALRLWARAREERLVTLAEWCAGRAVLATFRVPPLRERARFVLNALLSAREWAERRSPIAVAGDAAPHPPRRTG
jgi:glycosyltransferase involved in cell wall biosynthesis